MKTERDRWGEGSTAKQTKPRPIHVQGGISLPKKTISGIRK